MLRSKSSSLFSFAQPRTRKRFPLNNFVCCLTLFSECFFIFR